MSSPTSIIDIASFGTYPSYLTARLDGLMSKLGLSQQEIYGTNASFVKGDGDGDATVEIGPIGHVVSLNTGAIRETPVELWGNGTWVEMSAVATCSFDVRTAELLRIEYKPLPADAKRIVGKLNAAVEGDALEQAALAHNDNLANGLNAESQGEAWPPAARTPSDARGAVRRNTVHRGANPRSSRESRRVYRERGACRGHPRRGRGRRSPRRRSPRPRAWQRRRPAKQLSSRRGRRGR